jgi:hypothetical protein
LLLPLIEIVFFEIIFWRHMQAIPVTPPASRITTPQKTTTVQAIATVGAFVALPALVGVGLHFLDRALPQDKNEPAPPAQVESKGGLRLPQVPK